MQIQYKSIILYVDLDNWMKKEQLYWDASNARYVSKAKKASPFGNEVGGR